MMADNMMTGIRSGVVASGLVPMVVEQSARGERAYDIFFSFAEGAGHIFNGSC